MTIAYIFLLLILGFIGFKLVEIHKMLDEWYTEWLKQNGRIPEHPFVAADE